MFSGPCVFPWYPWGPNAFTQPLLFDDSLTVAQVLARQAKQIQELEARVKALEDQAGG